MFIDWEQLAEKQPALLVIPEGLRRAARIRSCSRGERLFRLGQPPEAMLFVLNGEIRLLRHDSRGTETILQRSGGGFVAEASLEARRYHCDVVAATEALVLLFPRALFLAELEQNTLFNRAWIQQLSREVRALRSRCERLSLNSAVDRIVHYIEVEGRNGAIVLNQTRKSWAAELGLTHETLYRTLRQLREVGDIRIDGDMISLCLKDRFNR